MPAKKVEQPVEATRRQSLIGALISALDDRNLSAALRVLEPAREGTEGQEEGERCVRCVTRGE